MSDNEENARMSVDEQLDALAAQVPGAEKAVRTVAEEAAEAETAVEAAVEGLADEAEAVVEAAAESMVEKAESLVDEIAGGAEAAADTTAVASADVAVETVEAAEAVEDAMAEAADIAGDAVGEAGEAMEDAVIEAADIVSRGAADAAPETPTEVIEAVPAPEAATEVLEGAPVSEPAAGSVSAPEAWYAPAADAGSSAAAASEPAPVYYAAGASAQAAAPKKKSRAWLWILIAVIVVALIGGGAYAVNASKKAEAYEMALAALDAGDYDGAISGFEELGSYKNASEMAEEARNAKAYEDAYFAYISGDYAAAAEGFKELGDYGDAAAMYEDASLWAAAIAAEEAAQDSGDEMLWAKAVEAYAAINDSSAEESAFRCSRIAGFYHGLGILEADPTDRDAVAEALPFFKDSVEDVSDAWDRADYCENVLKYYEARDLYDEGKYYDAYVSFGDVDGEAYEALGDVDKRRDACIQSTPANGTTWQNPNYSNNSVELTIDNSGNPNAYYKLYIGDDNVINVFIAAGAEATFYLPAGVYSMNKAYGDLWFGTHDMFGDYGDYYVCNFGGSSTFELEAGAGYIISAGSGGTGIGSQSTGRGSF